MVDWLWIDTRAWGYLVYTNIFLNIMILPSTHVQTPQQDDQSQSTELHPVRPISTHTSLTGHLELLVSPMTA